MSNSNSQPQKAQKQLTLSQVLEISRGKNGFGFTLSGQGPCFVSWVVADSPADEIGLMIGDYVISVNGKDVSTTNHEAVVKQIGISSGTLLLGVAKPKTGNSKIPFVGQSKTGSSSYQEVQKTVSSFSRTEKVLQDLHSGVMFKNLHSPTNLDGKTEKLNSNKLTNSLPNLVIVKSVVAYLGTVDMGNIELNFIEELSFSAVKGCVQALRMEQHIHQRVLMMVTQSCVKLGNADGDIIAVYKANLLLYSNSYLHDSRFFYLVTSQEPSRQSGARYMCHIFMIDPAISKHLLHVDKARRFGIKCTTDENGICVEFPSSTRSLLSVIQLLHITANEKTMRRSSLGGWTSDPSSHAMELERQSQILTRGESTLPRSIRINTSRAAWVEGSRRHKRDKLQNSRSRGSAYGSLSVESTDLEGNIPSDVAKNESYEKSHERIEEKSHEAAVQNSRVPPPMQRLSLGKYKIPEVRTPTGSLDRVMRKQKGSQHRRQNGKRHGRLFPSQVTSSYSVSKSSENVNASDEGDLMSAASSVESLASNTSLPGFINGPRADRATHRNSTPNTPSEEGAGRISHWAVSFDRLLEDPLGVRYFKEFLRKEFSEENILFWEACEELRRCNPDDVEKLKKEVADIYDRFLSLEAEMGVNIDSQGQQQAEEALQIPPHPNIFLAQQQQVYTLMKLDSYSRFLKSALYRQCMLSEMEGTLLPLEAADSSLDLNGSDSSRGGSRSLDSDTLQRQTKKFKSSKKGLFSKIRSKSQREKFAGAPLTRQSSGDSTGSDSCTPLHRAASLPTNSLDLVDPSRVCHVTLWDNTSTVICAKKSDHTTIGEALGELMERRGARISSVDVFLREDGQKRLLALDWDVSCLASQSIIIEQRTLLRIDIKPVGKSVSVKSRSSKRTLEVLESVLNKYELEVNEVVIKHSDDGRDVLLHEPVSTLDGLRILVEAKPQDSKHDKRREKTKSKSFKNSIPDKKDTEELIQLMSTLQNSKMDDQRGLLCKEDLELPEFLRIDENPNKNNNNSTRLNGIHQSEHTSWHSDSSSSPSSSGRYSNSDNGRRRSKSSDRKRSLYVELNARPKSLTTFKPVSKAPTTLDFCEHSSSDDCDTTIIEDSNIDLDLTLVPFPTPTRMKVLSDDLPMPNYSPPTPLLRK